MLNILLIVLNNLISLYYCSNIININNHNNIIHCPSQYTAVGDTCYYLSSDSVYL